MAVSERSRETVVASGVVVDHADLSPGDWAVLGLLCEQDAHGWSLVRALASEGEIGQVWTVPRGAVYRTLDVLLERGLVASIGAEPSVRGPRRTIMTVTTQGRSAVRQWLEEPVEHVRNLRSLLILKLVFGRRSGRDQRSMLHAQVTALGRMQESIEAKLATAAGTEELVLRFRLVSTDAARRFVADILDREDDRPSPPPP